MVAERYEFRDRVGAGRFGVVWKAFDTRLAREVAIKLVPLPDDPRDLARAEREAMAAARLDHPAVVTVYDSFVEDRTLYLVTELVRGPSLAARLQDGPLEPLEALRVGEAMAAALAHAHRRGVLHRDVKPANILLVPGAEAPAPAAKLADFGIAQVLGADSLTPTGMVVGTPRYMAPERVHGPAGPPADVFALGATLREALGDAALPAYAEAPLSRSVALDPDARPPAEQLYRVLARAARDRGDAAERTGATAVLPGPRDAGTAATNVLPDPSRPAAAEPARPPGGDPRPRWDAPRDHAEDPSRASAGSPHPGRTARLHDRVAHAAAILRPVLERRLADPRLSVAAASFAATLALILGPLRGEALLGLLAAAGVAALATVRPRLAWLVASGVAVGALVVRGQFGTALIFLLIAGGLPVVLRRRADRWWYAAAAPALGAVGLAAAFPVLVSRAGNRAAAVALSLAGFVTLALAEVATADTLLAGPARAASGPRAWRENPLETAELALWPLVSSPFVLFALAFAVVTLAVRWLLPDADTSRLGLRVAAAAVVAVGVPAVANELLAASVELAVPRGLLAGACLGVGALLVERWAMNRATLHSPRPSPATS